MERRVWMAVVLGASLAGCHKAAPPPPSGPTAEGINASVGAKMLCSDVFVAKRDVNEALTHDLLLDNPAGALQSGAVQVRQNPPAAIVRTATLTEEAVYRPGIGCTLLDGTPEAQVYNQVSVAPDPPPADRSADAWPDGEAPASLPKDVDAAAIDEAMAYAFAEPPAPAAGGEKLVRDTRAVVVIHHGHLIAEKYAAPYTAATPLLGYSMTKSLINTYAGLLVADKKLALTETPHVPEWPDGDPRRAITMDEMLHMSSGLQFEEVYSIPPKPVDVVNMLYASPDAAHYAAVKPLANPPGSVWQYSSGTTNLVSRSLRYSQGGSLADYLTYLHTHLFAPIGAYSAQMEPDATGTLVGSTFMYATARDWARIGQLYLQDGVWKGERILPEGWVKYTSTPAPKAPNGRYGAQFWLNAGDPETAANRSWPNVPPDAYAMIGYLGQAVMIIPSHDLVVVRLGQTMPDPPDPGRGDSDAFSLDKFVSLIVKAVPATKS